MDMKHDMDIIKIQGGISQDHRGQVKYINDFDMSEIRRFYRIKNDSIDLVRGWRGHKMERRWFHTISGTFVIDIVKIDDWSSPSPLQPIVRYVLDAESTEVLCVPKGYATAIKAELEDSEILVFSDFGITNADNDNYFWDLDHFKNRES